MAHRIAAKAAALFVKDKKLLLVFKGKIGFWITPGGKFEKGETPLQCLQREVREELGCRVTTHEYVGTVLEEIKEKPGHHIAILGYVCGFTGTPTPQKEISQAKWFTFDDIQQDATVAHGAKLFADDLREQHIL